MKGHERELRKLADTLGIDAPVLSRNGHWKFYYRGRLLSSTGSTPGDQSARIALTTDLRRRKRELDG